MSPCYRNLFFHSEYADLSIHCSVDKETLTAHKLVVAAASPVIKTKIDRHLSSSSAGSDTDTAIQVNVSSSTMRAVLQYVYIGEVVIHADDIEEFKKAATDLQISGMETGGEEGTAAAAPGEYDGCASVLTVGQRVAVKMEVDEEASRQQQQQQHGTSEQKLVTLDIPASSLNSSGLAGQSASSAQKLLCIKALQGGITQPLMKILPGRNVTCAKRFTKTSRV